MGPRAGSPGGQGVVGFYPREKGDCLPDLETPGEDFDFSARRELQAKSDFRFNLLAVCSLRRKRLRNQAEPVPERPACHYFTEGRASWAIVKAECPLHPLTHLLGPQRTYDQCWCPSPNPHLPALVWLNSIERSTGLRESSPSFWGTGLSCVGSWKTLIFNIQHTLPLCPTH